MRKLLRNFALAACGIVLFNASSFAVPFDIKKECKNNSCENFSVGMYRVKNTLTMNVLMEKQKGEIVKLRLLDSKGKVVHEESISKSLQKFGRKLNFSEVTDGKYTLEISDEKEMIVKNINLTTNEVSEAPGRTLVAMN
ncbi:MAG TPA: hypothetical protein VGN64_17515 [Dyadobacter sp.]|jgi:myo-inositol-hexaphosphate 3-phosphohydrolase|nr:hypothetical protein [Dyadobacter sp.]